MNINTNNTYYLSFYFDFVICARGKSSSVTSRRFISVTIVSEFLSSRGSQIIFKFENIFKQLLCILGHFIY